MSGSTSPLIINFELDGGQRLASRPSLLAREKTTSPLLVVRATWPIWKFWRKISVVRAGIRTPDKSQHNPVTVPIMLS